MHDPCTAPEKGHRGDPLQLLRGVGRPKGYTGVLDLQIHDCEDGSETGEHTPHALLDHYLPPVQVPEEQEDVEHGLEQDPRHQQLQGHAPGPVQTGDQADLQRVLVEVDAGVDVAGDHRPEKHDQAADQQGVRHAQQEKTQGGVPKAHRLRENTHVGETQHTQRDLDKQEVVQKLRGTELRLEVWERTQAKESEEEEGRVGYRQD